MEFGGRHVVVTGGTGALGSAVVGALVAAGAVCHVPWVDAAERAAFALGDDARVRLVAEGDMADEAAVARLYAGVPRLWASIHLIGGFAFGPVARARKDDLARLIDMNLMTCFLCCRAAANAMTAGGGRIVNVAARPALEWRQGAGMAAYAAAKAAVAAFTVAFAEEVAKHGILVNAVAPSMIDTPANRRDMPNADHAAWPDPTEIARSILFLASPTNAVTRGAIVPVYGRI
ncbi:MAG: SDR family NAD(P)-dependent oxidoreductase [Proteobacteria bacterium]|nr:SDR family NAD(P)-dependent oxidoreductase [Pseudomonadota bacterium]